jgi:hypothetical protein
MSSARKNTGAIAVMRRSMDIPILPPELLTLDVF